MSPTFGERDEWVRHELRRLVLRSPDRHFIVVRGEALCLMCEEEARVVQMRPVEKVAPALSDPVDGSVPCVLGLDAVVLGDDGVSTGAVGRYVSVGDVLVSCGGDMDLCGVDTMLSGAVSGGRCDLDRVSGGGDTDVCGVDTVVSGAISGCLCDLDSVSLGDLVVRVGEMSLSGGGDAVMSGVDESVCCVNSVLADGILDLESGVDDSMCVCGVSSVMTAGDLDVCGCDSLVSDGVGDSSGIEVVDDVVACGDDTPLLPDAFRVGGWLLVVGLGVAQPGWVDGLICADDSLHPEPPPTHAMCLCRSLLAAA